MLLSYYLVIDKSKYFTFEIRENCGLFSIDNNIINMYFPKAIQMLIELSFEFIVEIHFTKTTVTLSRFQQQIKYN